MGRPPDGRDVDELETAAIGLATEGAIGQLEITLASALGYLDLRLNDLNWRQQRPALATWFETLGPRPSVVQPRHPAEWAGSVTRRPLFAIFAEKRTVSKRPDPVIRRMSWSRMSRTNPADVWVIFQRA